MYDAIFSRNQSVGRKCPLRIWRNQLRVRLQEVPEFRSGAHSKATKGPFDELKIIIRFVHFACTSFLANAQIQKQKRMPLTSATHSNWNAREPTRKTHPPRRMQNNRLPRFVKP